MINEQQDAMMSYYDMSRVMRWQAHQIQISSPIKWGLLIKRARNPPP
jgi:hypothetical protein